MTDKFIAMTGLTVTENLGSQMWHFATLTSIAKRTGHRIVFFDELCEQGKGLKLDQHFKNLPLERVAISSMSDEERNHVVYPIPRDVIVDSNVFTIDPNHSYNFTGLFGSYRYWYPRRREIAAMYRFDPALVASCQVMVNKAREGGRQVVAVHVRRDDYINGIFINVTRDYYDAAFKHFDDAEVNYLVFSDDMPWCREAFADKHNVYYSDAPTPIADMCAMSLCDHNITANSSFSFWGAFLNEHAGKTMICPAKTLKNDRAIPHLNYAWHPDEFIGLDEGNV